MPLTLSPALAQLLLIGLLTCLLPRGAAAQTYNSITDFNTTGSGAWSYLAGVEPMIYDASAYGGSWRYNNGGSGDWCYIAATHQHPGTAGLSCTPVRRWTAPTAGTITISGHSRMTGANGGDGTIVWVKHNYDYLFAGTVAPSDFVTGVKWYSTRRVAAGDTVDLILLRNGNYYGDQQYVSQTITYQSGIYNSSADFSNPASRGWSYRDAYGVMAGWLPSYAGGAYTSTQPYGTDWCNIARDYQHPGTAGSTNDATRRWTAPSSGMLLITGTSRMSAANGGDGARVEIYKNGAANLHTTDVAANDTVGVSWRVLVNASAGDTIDTIVNKKSTYNGDEQIINQNIQYITFDAVGCNSCATAWDAVPWTYSIGGVTNYDVNRETDNANFAPNTDDFCDDQSPCHYINWLHHTRRFLANAKVQKVSLDISQFKTEYGYDFVDWDIPPGTNYLHGQPSVPFSWTIAAASGQSFQSTPGQLVFRSDYSGVNTGIRSDGVHVCCGTANDSVAALEPFYRTTGVLLGTNDTVYFKIAATSDQSIHSSIALQGKPGSEFDLYGKCGSKPTPTNFDLRGSTKGSQEFLHYIDYLTCPGGDMYFAVNSTGGNGWFNVIPARHYGARHRVLRVGTDYDANSPPSGALNYAQIQQEVPEGIRRWYGATEGTDWIETVHLYNSGGCLSSNVACGGYFCDVCVTNVADVSSWCRPNFAFPPMVGIQLSRGKGGDALVHEMGHCAWRVSTGLDIQDEYSGSPIKTTCGHSIMGFGAGGYNSNFCYYVSATKQDHGRDPQVGAGPPLNILSQWDVAYGMPGITPWKPSETPDNYSYKDFDFKGVYGALNVH